MSKVIEKLLPLGGGTNRSGEALQPTLVVVHSTANPEVDAEAHYQWWSGGYRASSAHYVVDWTQSIRLIPENEVAWHAGHHANHAAISIELCETADPVKAWQARRNLVDLLVDILRRQGWGVERVLCHAQVSDLDPEDTNHQDPIAYFGSHSWTWGALVADVVRALAGTAGSPGGQQVTVKGANGQLLTGGFLDSSGRTMIIVDGCVMPLRSIAQALHLVLTWNGDTKTATVSLPGK